MREPAQIARRLVAYGLSEIAESIAREHGTALSRMIRGARVDRKASAARHALWSSIYERTGWTLELVADLFGVDASTVCAGIDTHLNRPKRVA